MKQRGIRAEDIACKGGASYATVAQWLAGKHVTDESFEKIAAGLDLTVGELRAIVESPVSVGLPQVVTA